MAHDWGKNMITIKGNGIITIKLTKHLGINMKRLEILLCFDFIMASLMMKKI